MPTKQLEDARHERGNGIQAQPSAVPAAFCRADFRRVWLPEPAPADRPLEIHRVVAVSFSLDWRGHRMGDVSVLTVKERDFRA